MKLSENTKGSLILLLASVIWGSAFVTQSVGMDHVGPYTFQALRTLIGGIVLIPTFLIADQIKKKQGTYKKMTAEEKKYLLRGGVLCGLALCLASNLQQLGIVGTTVGKAGFITALYIVIVPFFAFFLGKRIKAHNWVCVALSVVGLYLLCMSESLSLSLYDGYVLACALVFSVHILIIDRYAPKTDCIRMSCIQMFVSGGISLVLMLVFEEPRIGAVANAWFPILYTGAFSSGIAYTLQMVGQKKADPTIASLVMSLESVFSVLAGMLFLSQIPTLREGLGCVIMFAAIIMAQLLDEYPPAVLWGVVRNKITGKKSRKDAFR